MEKFPCTSCGACCRRADKAIIHSKTLSELTGNPGVEFPFSHNSGVCEKLIDNMCSIYHDRPLFCRTDEMAEVLGIDIAKFFRLNALACNEIIREDGLDDKYLINL